MPTRVASVIAALLFGSASLHADPKPVDKDSAAFASPPTDPWAPYEHWITGEFTLENGMILFHTDKPVAGDTEGNVVVLGATRSTVAVLIPIFERCAERHLKMRLFGALLPFAGTFKDHPGPLPKVEFIAWKIHDPSDPDELPLDQKMIINGTNTTLGGKPVTLIDTETGKDFQPAKVANTNADSNPAH